MRSALYKKKKNLTIKLKEKESGEDVYVKYLGLIGSHGAERRPTGFGSLYSGCGGGGG